VVKKKQCFCNKLRSICDKFPTLFSIENLRSCGLSTFITQCTSAKEIVALENELPQAVIHFCFGCIFGFSPFIVVAFLMSFLKVVMIPIVRIWALPNWIPRYGTCSMIVDYARQNGTRLKVFRDGGTAIHEAVIKSWEIQELLEVDLEHDDKGVNVLNNNGKTALCLAVEREQDKPRTQLVEALVRCDDGAMALCFASKHGQVDVFSQLLEARANPNVQSDDGKSLLCLAMAAGHQQMLDPLLGTRANVNIQSVDGMTPLCLAVKALKNSTLIQPLLDARADVHFRSGETLTTPLCLAAQTWQESTVVIEKLLEAEADIEAKDHDGMTPLYLAAAKGLEVNCAQLLRANADINGPLVAIGEKKMIKLLLGQEMLNFLLGSELVRLEQLLESPQITSDTPDQRRKLQLEMELLLDENSQRATLDRQANSLKMILEKGARGSQAFKTIVKTWPSSDKPFWNISSMRQLLA